MPKLIDLIKAHWPQIVGAAYILLNLINASVKGPEAKSVVGKLIDMLSILTRKEGAGTLKAPFKKSRAHGSVPAPAGGAKALLPFICLPFVGLMLASCACFTDAHRNDKGCVVLNQLIDCTKGAVTTQLSNTVVGLVGGLISGSSVDWGMVLDRLELAGIKDGGCILAQLENDFMSKPAVSPERMAKVATLQGAMATWKTKHGLIDVKYKSMVGGKEVLR